MTPLTANVSHELLAAADLLEHTSHRLRALVAGAQPLRRVCSWCQVLIVDGALPITHGICPACVSKFEAGEKP